jgi:large subunit ribosomal protein L2
MPLVKVKPTSPGRRALVKVVKPELHKGDPHWPLTVQQSRGSGRNNHGRVTMRHQGGGHKHHLRIVDFRRNKDGIEARVERLEYDPNRSAHLALLLYKDGECRYIVAPKGVQAGAQLMSGVEAPIKPGNALPLRNIPVGTIVHCVEMMPGKGAQLARSAGAGVQVLAREGSYAQLRLRSGEIRKVHIDCRATIGEAGNPEHNLESIGKAGRKRWRGIRPSPSSPRPPLAATRGRIRFTRCVRCATTSATWSRVMTTRRSCARVRSARWSRLSPASISHTSPPAARAAMAASSTIRSVA